MAMELKPRQFMVGVCDSMGLQMAGCDVLNDIMGMIYTRGYADGTNSRSGAYIISEQSRNQEIDGCRRMGKKSRFAGRSYV